MQRADGAGSEAERERSDILDVDILAAARGELRGDRDYFVLCDVHNLVDVVAAEPGEDTSARFTVIEEPVLWVAHRDLGGDHAHFDRDKLADQSLLDDAAGVADRVQGAVLVEDAEFALLAAGDGCDLLAFDSGLADRFVGDQMLAGFKGTG